LCVRGSIRFRIQQAKRACDASASDAKTTLKDTLQAFSNLGSALLEAHEDQASLSDAVQNAGGWLSLKGLVATAAKLTDTLVADPLAHVVHGYHRFRRYAPRMLRALDIHAAQVAEPLLVAAGIVAGTETTASRPLTFLRRASKWHRHLNNDDGNRLWEVAVLCHPFPLLAAQVVVNRLPRGGIMRQQQPRAACAKQIQDRLDDLALRRAARATAWSCLRDHRLITGHWPFVRSLG
jgi:hypothetical protein